MKLKNEKIVMQNEFTNLENNIKEVEEKEKIAFNKAIQFQEKLNDELDEFLEDVKL